MACVIRRTIRPHRPGLPVPPLGRVLPFIRARAPFAGILLLPAGIALGPGRAYVAPFGFFGPMAVQIFLAALPGQRLDFKRIFPFRSHVPLEIKTGFFGGDLRFGRTAAIPVQPDPVLVSIVHLFPDSLCNLAPVIVLLAFPIQVADGLQPVLCPSCHRQGRGQ